MIYTIDQILAKSLKNWHAPGLDSIVLGEGDNGELIRAFWARKGHSLGVRHPLSDQLQIAFHNHHCAIDFLVLQGCIINCRIDSLHGVQGGRVSAWEFRSKIVAPDNHPGFVPGSASSPFMYAKFRNDILTSEVDCRETFMNADDYHTVFVPSEEAVWLLHEYPTEYGRSAKKTVFSNNDLSRFSFDDLYQPFTNADEVQHILDITAPWL